MIEQGFKVEDAHPATGQPDPGIVFHGSFADRMCYLIFRFKANSFYLGEVQLRSYDYQPPLEAYDHFVTLLTAKYGGAGERLPVSSATGANRNMPDMVKWNWGDDGSMDVYKIEVFVSDSVYELHGDGARCVVQLIVRYEAVSLGNKLKEDGL